MTLFFLRHGEADWPDWDRPDDERPLTKRGKKEMRRVARFLFERQVQPTRILSSPLPRAWQTAEIAAEHLRCELSEERTLAGRFDVAKLKAILKRHPDEDLMLVGHEPSFSAVIRSLTGGEVKMAKAGVARVDLAGDGRAGRLIWLLPPQISAA